MARHDKKKILLGPGRANYNLVVSWKEYYEKTKNNPPRPLLLRALATIESDQSIKHKTAIDIGCGAGQDTRELLRRGWSVTAIDSEVESIEALKIGSSNDQLNCLLGRFEDLAQIEPATFVYASLSLPFCPKDQFDHLWTRVTSAVRPGGWIAFNFFGPEDDWVNKDLILGLSHSQIESLLSGFAQVAIEETKKHGPSVTGDSKHWHIFDVVAQAPSVEHE